MTEPAKATASATAAATRRAGSSRRGPVAGGRPATLHPSTAVRVRALLPFLSPAERRAAQVVLKEPALVATRTITALAERANTSEATVIRFCRALGVTGYPELRLTLATEAGRLAGGAATRRVVDGDIGPGDDLAEVVEKVTYADATSVEDTAAQLDLDVLRQVVAALAAANRVDIHGVGASGVVALDFQQKLHRIGRVAFAWADPHVALTSAALLAPGDVAVAISHTGARRAPLRYLGRPRDLRPRSRTSDARLRRRDGRRSTHDGGDESTRVTASDPDRIPRPVHRRAHRRCPDRQLRPAGTDACRLGTGQRRLPRGDAVRDDRTRSPDARARALSVVLGGTTLALVAGVPAGALLGSLSGWRTALWAVAVICLPALVAVPLATPTRPPTDGPTHAHTSLCTELRNLRRHPLQANLVLAMLVNGATFCTFTYLAPVATGAAGLDDSVVPLVLGLVGVGAFVGVSTAGRLADRHWVPIVAICGFGVLVGWLLLAVAAANPVAVLGLAVVQGGLSFALGGTVIARVMATAEGAPSMGGAFATTALSVGAFLGPVLGGVALERSDARGPVLVSAALVLAALVVWAAWAVTVYRTSGVAEAQVGKTR